MINDHYLKILALVPILDCEYIGMCGLRLWTALVDRSLQTAAIRCPGAMGRLLEAFFFFVEKTEESSAMMTLMHETVQQKLGRGR